MKKILSFISRYSLLIVFTLFILGFGIADIVTPDRERSEFENTELQQRPTATVQTLLNAKFQTDYETYVNEQFIGRDSWISLKSFLGTAMAKTENNSVVYGKDGYLFEKLTSIDLKRLQMNLNSVKTFAENYPESNISFALVPNSYEILSDKLPYAIELADQKKLINNAYEYIGGSAQTIDLYTDLYEHNDEYIYYRTDHHWTTLGADYAYYTLSDELSFETVDTDSLQSHEVKDFYGTFYSKAKPHSAESDTITFYEVDATLEILDSDFNVTNEYQTLYDEPKFETRDKYAAFMYGNNALSVVTNENASSPSRLLLIKDSYSNSLIPFLSQSYSEIYVVDLRYLSGISSVMGTFSFDDVLILYNVSTFVSDSNVSYLKY